MLLIKRLNNADIIEMKQHNLLILAFYLHFSCLYNCRIECNYSALRYYFIELH